MPDTTSSYYAGYAVAAIIYFAYAVTLWARARKLRARLDGVTRSQ